MAKVPVQQIITRLKLDLELSSKDCDFVKLYSHYAAFHTHPINKLIHMVGIPTLYIMTLSLIDSIITALIFDPLEVNSLDAIINSAHLPLLHYMGLMAAGAEPISAMLAASTFLYYAVISSTLFQWLGPGLSFQLGTLFGLLCWSTQLYGHCVYESNIPALFKRPCETILVAPYYIVMEVLFYLGYKPHLYDAVNKVAYELRLYYDMPIVV
eukprot:Blabericola_migrator_1__2371@NODE_1665_length_4054_cov_138_103085_g1082_i0_p3_GENE_NODE_1665_length_4054_cov_138_103085_g1082_i0NODE_1665_length_4054_cov_138_103085_g1082_i0_p3_ORF_typecomplete_len211_score29_84DUF962/PF06127_11/1e18SHR3_chaperone/PF08229_11/72SHR3_chaperone/PF08229_11/1_3_NODE_1665_length_4054_cov_138_103085_g1082_i031223754